MDEIKAIRTAIVDDEPLARKNIRSLLKRAPEFYVVAECRNGQEALDVVQAQGIDLLFLDIQMPEMTGFEAIEQMLRPLPVIIFVTAFDQFALRAFEVNAVDYLLKPVDRKRFEVSLERAKELIRTRDFKGLEAKIDAVLSMRSEALRESSYLRRIPVRTADRLILVATEDIDYIEANDYYAALHVGEKTHLIREPMKELEKKLDPEMFLRIHRSTIVNIKRIREVRSHATMGRSVKLLDGRMLRLSRSRWEEVQARLTK